MRVLNRQERVGAARMITPYSMQKEGGPDQGLHILLAEDNPVNQKLALRLLEKRGHRVEVAANGRQALSALEKGSYDLVLMDVQMPEMDGLEATTLLREREQLSGRHQAVVAMTALVMKGDRERCMAAGMDGYISKPIRPQELDEVLDLYRANQPQETVAGTTSDLRDSSVCVEDLFERIDGDRVLLAELLDLLRQDSSVQLQAAHEAIANGDTATLQRVGHALKGALGNLAAPAASQTAGELESMGMTGEIAQAETKLCELESELARVLEALEALCLETAK
jgi:CheY-like chemotaxis protein